MKTRQFYITNQKGLKLSAKLDLPESGEVNSYAIYSHCFTCTMELKAIYNINTVLTQMGIAVIRFDMTGIGGSEGNFADTNFTTQIEDMISVSDYLSLHYEPAKLLIGHSIGGSVALFSAFQMKHLKAIATIASPAEPSHLAINLKNTKQRAVNSGFTETEIGGVKYIFKPQFFEDIESYSLGDKLPELGKPYLILHSTVDTYSSMKNAEILFKNASQPKSFISLDNIDHLMLKKEDAVYVGKLIGTWAEKYL